MATLIETPEWVSTVYQIETTDSVIGGLGGVANSQALSLAKRTAWLKEMNESIVVSPITSLTHLLTPLNAGMLLRFTADGSKTLTINASSGHIADRVYHIANRSTFGDITISLNSIAVNLPKQGTLILEPGDTATLHTITNTVMDLYGSTKAAI